MHKVWFNIAQALLDPCMGPSDSRRGGREWGVSAKALHAATLDAWESVGSSQGHMLEQESGRDPSQT